jgi:site-specific recombinase XerD
MKTSISDAIEIGVKTYQVFGYCSRMASDYRNVCQQFKEHMEKNRFPYSSEQAIKWVESHKDFGSAIRWKRKHVVAMAKALVVLDDIIRNGRVTSTLKPSACRMTAYDRLPVWSKKLLDEYLDVLPTIYQPNTIRLVGNYCSRFLLALENGGIRQISDISPEVIEKYFEADVRLSSSAQKESKRYVCKFLIFANVMEAMPPKPLLRIPRKFAVSRTQSVDELEESVRSKFNIYLNNDKDATEASIKEYDGASAQLLKTLCDKQYSESSIVSTDRILRTFRSFLQINLYPYSHALSLEWISFMQTRMQSRSEYNRYRRVILSIHEILTTGNLKTYVFTSNTPKYQNHGWQNDLLNQYLAYRDQEGCAESTRKGIGYACSRFFSFLNQEGIETLKEITPELMYQFNLQDPHQSLAGKNLYASRIRLFLRYLGERGLVPATLELVIANKYAPNERVIHILDEEQVNAIYDYRKDAKSPLDLRDSAILLLGLRMGIRRSDIANLKFSNISLKEKTILIAQQKTGAAFKLPIPVDVGNSLYKYIQYGRPTLANCEYVFVRHNAPYCKLTSGGIGKRIRSCMLEYNNVAINGLHILRKTFASSLLRAGNSIHIIAPALGHANFSSVNKYLSTDDDQLKKCAIGLGGIEYMGGYRL